MPAPNIIHVFLLVVNMQTGEADIMRDTEGFQSMEACQSWLAPVLARVSTGLSSDPPQFVTLSRNGVRYAVADGVCRPDGFPT